MTIQSVVLACSSTPTSVAGSGTHGVIRVLLKAVAGTCYLGNSAVTTAGYALSTADASHNETVLGGEQLFVASSAGASASLAVLRSGDTT